MSFLKCTSQHSTFARSIWRGLLWLRSFVAREFRGGCFSRLVHSQAAWRAGWRTFRSENFRKKQNPSYIGKNQHLASSRVRPRFWSKPQNNQHLNCFGYTLYTLYTLYTSTHSAYWFPRVAYRAKPRDRHFEARQKEQRFEAPGV